jgi:hypothetical protein
VEGEDSILFCFTDKIIIREITRKIAYKAKKNTQKMIVKKWEKTRLLPKMKKTIPGYAKKSPFSKTEGPSISWRS